MTSGRRIEVLLIVGIVALGAVAARALYIPPYYDRQVDVAEERLNLDVGEPSKWFSAWSVGDGQAFAVIAADPSGTKAGEELKVPAYRFARAGFGWLAYAASLGHERWIPQGMAITGGLVLLGTLILAIHMRTRLGVSAWWLVLNPSIYLGFAGDTAEPLGALLLAASLAYGSFVAALALGVSRPTYLISLFGRWRLMAVGVASASALGLYSIWKFGVHDLVPPGGFGVVPLQAFLTNPSVGGIAVAACGVATFVIGSRHRDWAWVASGLLVIFLGPEVTADPINAWRAAGMLPVLWAFGPGYAIPQERHSRRAAGPVGTP